MWQAVRGAHGVEHHTACCGWRAGCVCANKGGGGRGMRARTHSRAVASRQAHRCRRRAAPACAPSPHAVHGVAPHRAPPRERQRGRQPSHMGHSCEPAGGGGGGGARGGGAAGLAGLRGEPHQTRMVRLFRRVAASLRACHARMRRVCARWRWHACPAAAASHWWPAQPATAWFKLGGWPRTPHPCTP